MNIERRYSTDRLKGKSVMILPLAARHSMLNKGLHIEWKSYTCQNASSGRLRNLRLCVDGVMPLQCN